VNDYENALKVDPEDTGVLNNLAWVLATSTDDKVRNADRSIELGKKACELTKYEKPHILSTLAAGYAESGKWDEALKWSKKAVELGEGEVSEQLKQELESYEQKKPWREKQETEENTKPIEPMPSDLET
jgi:tetratricopeptide (TPR) repeat protein